MRNLNTKNGNIVQGAIAAVLAVALLVIFMIGKDILTIILALALGVFAGFFFYRAFKS